MTALSKAWVWGRSPAEIVDSNPAGAFEARFGLWSPHTWTAKPKEVILLFMPR